MCVQPMFIPNAFFLIALSDNLKGLHLIQLVILTDLLTLGVLT